MLQCWVKNENIWNIFQCMSSVFNQFLLITRNFQLQSKITTRNISNKLGTNRTRRRKESGKCYWTLLCCVASCRVFFLLLSSIRRLDLARLDKVVNVEKRNKRKMIFLVFSFPHGNMNRHSPAFLQAHTFFLLLTFCSLGWSKTTVGPLRTHTFHSQWNYHNQRLLR